MNIELLRTFLEVARLRHFGRSAEGLFITQAAVSARIKTLESQLGVSLFDRGRSGVRLTPAGHRLLRHAESIVAGWRKARQDVALGEGAEQLSIGGSLRLWDAMLQDWLHRIHADAGDTAIIAECHTPEVLTRRLLDGSLDLAIMLEPAQLEQLQTRKVGQLTLDLVTTDTSTAIQPGLHEGYIFVDWGLAHGVEHARQFSMAPPPQIRLGQARMAIAYLLKFGGSAYLPKALIGGELADRRLSMVAGAPQFSYAVFCAYRSGTARLKSIEHILTLL